MTIKDIAELAGVSVSTVSKIVNKKDKEISPQTRAHVLEIVKKYNYQPYAKIKSMAATSTFLLGVSLSAGSERSVLLDGVMELAKEQGYDVITRMSATAEEELQNISALCSRGIDGIIWERSEDSRPECAQVIKKAGIPSQMIDFTVKAEDNGLYFDIGQAGYAAAQVLIQSNHHKIACLTSGESYKSSRIVSGFKRCLYEYKIPFDAQMMQIWQEDAENDPLMLYKCTGIVCENMDLTAKLYEYAYAKNIRIPKDLSVVCLSEPRAEWFLMPPVSFVQLPYMEFGRYVCQGIIQKIEKPNVLLPAFHYRPEISHQQSVDVPDTLRNKKIVVVGAMNMDILITLERFPEMGETITARNHITLPGGKGLNQVLGAAKLGADAYLIGKVGKDYDGSMLCDYLKVNNVDTTGIAIDKNAGTGRAYIYVQEDGESGIVISQSANQDLSVEDVKRNKQLFKDAAFCLLQTEIPIKTVEYAAFVARSNQVKVILKPSTVSALSEELMKHVDILLPNKKEINALLPGDASYEEKAQYFLERGVKTVIITLGHKGCYLRDNQHSRYFQALDIKPVDTTGAADGFAAALAVYLSKNYEIDEAVRYATCAAGLSTTRQGVPPSLVDQETLELYMTKGGM